MKCFIFLVFIVIFTTLVSTHNVLGSKSKMGVTRISNSMSDTNNLFKHEVRLTTEEGSLCSGTIISDNHILTAGHCVIVKDTDTFISIYKQLMEVTVGITLVNNPFEFQTVRLVEKIYVPQFFANTAKNDADLTDQIGDIAVLKLNYKLGLGIDPRIEAFNLPKYEFNLDNQNSKEYLMFTGFGGTKAVYNPNLNDYMPGVFPSYLQYSEARVLSSCNSLGHTKLKMCAQLVNAGAGICGGDSGGALIDYEEKTIIGVLGYGSKMCNGATPGVYTQVFPYNRFINNAMNDITDEIARSVSFEANYDYQYALEKNPWKYHWIYRVDDNVMMTQNLYYYY